MGIAYQLMFNFTDAMHCYPTSHKLDPKNSSVLNNLGTVYDALKQYHNAEKMYRKALKIDPNSALIHKNLGTNLLSQHKYAKGWEEYQAAVEDRSEYFRQHCPTAHRKSRISVRPRRNELLPCQGMRAGRHARARHSIPAPGSQRRIYQPEEDQRRQRVRHPSGATRI